MNSLARLVRRAQQGEEEAFALLFGEMFPLAYRWALMQTGSADDAHDVAQEALITAWRRITEFRGDSHITTWLYTIVRRTSADWRRAGKRRRAREARYAADAPTVLQPPRDRRLGQQLAAVLELLERLPARQREIFDLVELQGLPMTEVTSLTGLQPSTVRVHLLRARRALRSRMLNEKTLPDGLHAM